MERGATITDYSTNGRPSVYNQATNVKYLVTSIVVRLQPGSAIDELKKTYASLVRLNENEGATMNTNVSDTTRSLRRLDTILIQFNILILNEQEQMQGAKGALLAHGFRSERRH